MNIKEQLWRQGLDQGVFMRFRPLGSSMLPFLKEGDIVTIAPVTDLKIGDVVLWQRGEAMVLHRVVLMVNGHVVTKGDALRSLDLPLCRGDILGLAVARERNQKLTRLENFRFRYVGMLCSLALILLPESLAIMAVLKRFGRKRLGLASE
jgi:hypothetical protein